MQGRFSKHDKYAVEIEGCEKGEKEGKRKVNPEYSSQSNKEIMLT